MNFRASMNMARDQRAFCLAKSMKMRLDDAVAAQLNTLEIKACFLADKTRQA